MYKPIVERWPKRAPSLAFVCYFLAFVVAGAWHGSTMNFLVYGVWQGVGASATKLYNETWIIRRHGRNGLREHLQSPTIRVLAILANFHFQCLSLALLLAEEHRRRRSCSLFRGLGCRDPGPLIDNPFREEAFPNVKPHLHDSRSAAFAKLWAIGIRFTWIPLPPAGCSSAGRWSTDCTRSSGPSIAGPKPRRDAWPVS